MAEMTGVHVEMGVAVKAGASDLFYGIWSETIALAGTTNQTAVGDASLKGIAKDGVMVFRVRAQSAGAVYVARGQTPDASKVVSTNRDNVRSHLVAGESRDIPCQPGDKLNCVTAS